MKTLIIITLTTALAGTVTANSASTIDSSSLVKTLATSWAETTYQQPKSERTQQLHALTRQSKLALAEHPGDPRLLAWAGIISASYAGSRGGLGALKMAKKARSHLEKAMQIDAEALNGGARTSLGALYYQVPGWPIGFGDNAKAEQLLSESVEKHPNNVTTLYFYADYLLDQKRFREARDFFKRAASIAPREDAIVADRGRQAQIRDKLKLLEKILG